jgi:hypothetical protein
MRRLIAILVLTPAAVLVPATAAHADPAGTGYRGSTTAC